MRNGMTLISHPTGFLSGNPQVHSHIAYFSHQQVSGEGSLHYRTITAQHGAEPHRAARCGHSAPHVSMKCGLFIDLKTATYLC